MNTNDKYMICSFCGTKNKIKSKRLTTAESKKIKPLVLKYLIKCLDSGSGIDNQLVFRKFYQVKESTLLTWIYKVKPPHDRKIVKWEIRNLLRRNKFLSNKDIYAKYAKYPNISNRTLLRWIKSIKRDLNII